MDWIKKIFQNVGEILTDKQTFVNTEQGTVQVPNADDDKAIGMVRNAVQNPMEFIAPSRGFDTKATTPEKMPDESMNDYVKRLSEDRRSRIPSQSAIRMGAARLPAELASGVGGLLSMVPGIKQAGNKALDTNIGQTLASVGSKIVEFGKPKTAEEARAMQMGDILSLPFGVSRIDKIDNLVAANRVRIMSKNGKNLYQVKTATGAWQAVANADDAVRLANQIAPAVKPTQAAVQSFSPDQAKTYDSILTEFSAAEAGERIATFDDMGVMTGKVAKNSTFPQWLDPDLRNKKLLDQYVGDRTGEAADLAKTYKPGSRLDRIDQAVKEQIAKTQAATPAKAPQSPLPVAKPKPVEAPPSKPTPVPREEVASLEDLASQSREALPTPVREKVPSLEKIVTQPTPVDRKVNFLDYLRTPNRVLEKIGFANEAKLLREKYDDFVVELPKQLDRVTEWSKQVPKESSQRLFKYLDGQDIKLTAKEQKVADEIRVYLDEWADRLKLPKENRIANYITRLFEDQFIQKEFDEDLAKIIADRVPGSVYNPFLEKRLGAKGYKEDVWEALDAYVKRATRKVNLDPALERISTKTGGSLDMANIEESQWKYVKNYIDRVNMRPTDMDKLLDNAIKQTVGYRFGQRPVTALSQGLRRMTYRGMLGANLGSALRNLSQGVNTYATLGEKYTAIGYSKLFSKSARAELAASGVLDNAFIQDRAISATKQALQKADKALWFFFDGAEKINRGAAYFGAKAKGLAQGMNEQQAIEYAKSIVRKTQFNYDAVDTPIALSTDLVKTLLQFQTYTVKQVEFLTELAKDRNFAALARYALAGYLFVNTVGKAVGMEEGELVPLYDYFTGERKFGTPPALKFPVELTKAVFNAPDKYGNERDLETKVEDVARSGIGLIPGGAQARKTIEGMQVVEEGGSFDQAGRLQYEQEDSQAAKLQTILFGKYASDNAKQYFDDREENKTSGNKALDKALKEQQESKRTAMVEELRIHKELKALPPEEANQRLKEIYEKDRALYKRIVETKKKEDLDAKRSDTEKEIMKLGVENGARARFIVGQLRQLETPEEKNAYLKDLWDKKIVTKDVLKQIKELEGK